MSGRSLSRGHRWPSQLGLLLSLVALLSGCAMEARVQRPLPGVFDLAKVAPPTEVIGEKKILVVAVRFKKVDPGITLDDLDLKIAKVNGYIRGNASYGKAWLAPRRVGWYWMPDNLEAYEVSPHNYEVDRDRVRQLLTDALSAASGHADLAAFDYIWVVVGAHTTPGTGYGMIAYAANPGMLSGVRGKAYIEPIPLNDGSVHEGPVIVSASNAHPGHVAHDLLHAMGGVQGGRRAGVDLYDFDLQSNPPPDQPMSPALFSIHAGPWDIMSEHFIDRDRPPPPPSSFTRLQLGWITQDQIVEIPPGETRIVTLDPLARGHGTLGVRIPIDRYRYILLENRQPVGGDQVLPSGGMLVLEVDTTINEGAGIVKVADANPKVPGLNQAPFQINAGEHRFYENRKVGVAAAPLGLGRRGALQVVVTVPERIGEFLRR